MLSLKDFGLVAGALVALRYVPNASPIRVAKRDELGALYILHHRCTGWYGRQRRGIFLLIPGLMTYRHAKASLQSVRSDNQSFTLADGFVFQMTVSVEYRIVSIEQAVVQVGDLEQILRRRACRAVTKVLSGMKHDALQNLAVVEAAALAELDLSALGLSDGFIELTDLQPSLATAHLLLAEARKQEADRMVANDETLDPAHAIALVSWSPALAVGSSSASVPSDLAVEIDPVLAAVGNGHSAA